MGNSIFKPIVGITFLFLGVVFFFMSLFFMYSFVTDSGSDHSTITVNGNSHVEVEAEVFSITLGVEHLSTSARDAENDVRAEMNVLIDRLKDLGLTDNELRTQNFNIYENYRWTATSDDEIEYRASQSLLIESDQLELLPQILDVSSEVGANRIFGLQFDITDETRDSLRESLLEQAVSQTRDEADVVARAAGSSVIGVKDIQLFNYHSTPYRDVGEIAVASIDSGTQLPTIQEGKVRVQASVNVVYRIR